MHGWVRGRALSSGWFLSGILSQEGLQGARVLGPYAKEGPQEEATCSQRWEVRFGRCFSRRLGQAPHPPSPKEDKASVSHLLEEATGVRPVLDRVREKRFKAVTSPPACPAKRDLERMAQAEGQ